MNLYSPLRISVKFLCLMYVCIMTMQEARAKNHNGVEACERPQQLRFSIIPQGDVQQDFASLQPLMNELRDALNIPITVIQPKSYGAVIEGLLSGSVDLARLGPASYVAAKQADPFITAFASYARKSDIFKQESAAYYSLLIVKASAHYSSLQELGGQKVALVDPNSTSGAVIPRYMTERELNSKFEKHFRRIVYTGNHDSSIRLLMRDGVAAAFVSSSHLSDLVETGEFRLTDFKILWRSKLIPRDPFVYRGQLCEDIKQKISHVFLKSNGENLQLLMKNIKATRFLPVSDSDYQIIREVTREK